VTCNHSLNANANAAAMETNDDDSVDTSSQESYQQPAEDVDMEAAALVRTASASSLQRDESMTGESEPYTDAVEDIEDLLMELFNEVVDMDLTASADGLQQDGSVDGLNGGFRKDVRCLVTVHVLSLVSFHCLASVCQFTLQSTSLVFV